jgi:LmbE family N-acetylglucosaminyl deacetylase
VLNAACDSLAPLRAGAVLARARQAPLVSLAALTGNAPVLVLAPHPDDESLGCGGLIAACCAAGMPIAVVLLTDGAGSHPGSRSHPPDILARLRLAEMVAALAELGLDPPLPHKLGWPDQQAPTGGPEFDRAVAQLSALVRRTGARTIVAAWRHDPHCDHAAGAAIAAAAAAATQARHLAYPVWGWTLDDSALVSAGPPVRLDVARHLPAKRRAVACHRSQHGAVIHDSPRAFHLPAHLLEACLTGQEVYFEETVA